MPATARRAAFRLAAIAAAVAGVACSENLDAGGVCTSATSLCPGQALQYRDTIINPSLIFDSTYSGFPFLGAEAGLPLIGVKDTLETVAVIRFDTLTTLYTPAGDTARTIFYVDSSRLRLLVDLTGSRVPDTLNIDVYDVDNGLTDDTTLVSLKKRLVPKYRIGGGVFSKAAIIDSLFVPLSDSALLAHVLNTDSVTKARLRVAVRASSPLGPVVFKIGSIESGAAASLRYRPSNDTAARALAIAPASSGPLDRNDVRGDLMDYSMVTLNTLPDTPGAISLGGVPGRRTYLRFDLPRRITDSTTVIRATLRLTQFPYPFGSATDTVVIHPHIVLAQSYITDYRRAAAVIGATGLVITDSLTVFPRDSGLKTVELYPVIRQWAVQAQQVNPPPRAVVLIVTNEAGAPYRVNFFPNTARADLRPSVRLTYIPKVDFGVP